MDEDRRGSGALAVLGTTTHCQLPHRLEVNGLSCSDLALGDSDTCEELVDGAHGVSPGTCKPKSRPRS